MHISNFDTLIFTGNNIGILSRDAFSKMSPYALLWSFTEMLPVDTRFLKIVDSDDDFHKVIKYFETKISDSYSYINKETNQISDNKKFIEKLNDLTVRKSKLFVEYYIKQWEDKIEKTKNKKEKMFNDLMAAEGFCKVKRDGSCGCKKFNHEKYDILKKEISRLEIQKGILSYTDDKIHFITYNNEKIVTQDSDWSGGNWKKIYTTADKKFAINQVLHRNKICSENIKMWYKHIDYINDKLNRLKRAVDSKQIKFKNN